MLELSLMGWNLLTGVLSLPMIWDISLYLSSSLGGVSGNFAWFRGSLWKSSTHFSMLQLARTALAFWCTFPSTHRLLSFQSCDFPNHLSPSLQYLSVDRNEQTEEAGVGGGEKKKKRKKNLTVVVWWRFFLFFISFFFFQMWYNWWFWFILHAGPNGWKPSVGRDLERFARPLLYFYKVLKSYR